MMKNGPDAPATFSLRCYRTGVDKGFSRRAASIFLPFFPILSQYSLGSLNYGVVGLLLIAILSLISAWRSNRRLWVEPCYFALLLYVLLVNSLTVISKGVFGAAFFNGILNIIIVLFISTFLSGQISKDLLFKAYSWLAVPICITVVLQSFQVYFADSSVSPILIFPVSDHLNWAEGSMRPVSFFQEPQALASWFVPLIYFTIERKLYYRSVLLSICTMLCGSTFGIFSLVFVWIYILVESKVLEFRKLLVIAVFGIAVILLLHTSQFSSIIDKAFNATAGFLGHSDLTVSDYSRLYKAYDTFCELSLSDKIFGIGYGTISTLISRGVLSFTWQVMTGMSVAQSSYMSTLFGVFVVYGLIGGVLFWLPLFASFRSSSPAKKFFSLLILFSAVSSSLLFNSSFIFLYLLFLSYGGSNETK